MDSLFPAESPPLLLCHLPLPKIFKQQSLNSVSAEQILLWKSFPHFFHCSVTLPWYHLFCVKMNIRRPECHYGFGASHKKQYDEETKSSLINPRDSITSACLSLLHFSGIILHYISAAWYVLRSRYACLNTDVVEMYRRRLFCKNSPMFVIIFLLLPLFTWFDGTLCK